MRRVRCVACDKGCEFNLAGMPLKDWLLKKWKFYCPEKNEFIKAKFLKKIKNVR